MRRASRSDLLPDEEPNPSTSSQRRLQTAGTYFAGRDFERTAAGVPLYLAGDQYPLVRARINDRLENLVFLDTGMIGAAIGLPFSSAEEAEVEVARDISVAGFGIASEMPARPVLCRSIEAAGARRSDLPGVLIGAFRLEHRFGFHIGGLLGDGFVRGGVLTLDFQNMRLTDAH